MVEAIVDDRDFWVKADGSSLTDAEPVTLVAWRGSGRTDQRSVYSAHATGPIMGSATDRYYAAKEEDARFFGPTVEKHTLVLKKPLILDSREKWFEVFEPLDDGDGLPGTSEDDKRLYPWLRKKLVEEGYDSLIVNVPNGVKMLSRPFSNSQVIVFGP